MRPRLARPFPSLFSLLLLLLPPLVLPHPLAVAFASARAAAEAEADPSALDRVLARHVRGEGVDYLLLRRDSMGELEAALDQLAEVDPAALRSEDERLAHWIDLYNATVLHALAKRLDAGTKASDADFGLFEEPLVRTSRGRISLNELEHERIRKVFRDPRVHAALVCGARSCPPLRAEAWRGGDLDEELEARMRAFVRDERRNSVDHEARVLRLSRIFEWFAEDFGGAATLPAYVGRYLGRDVSDYRVEFEDYSWELNIVPPAEGEWVVARRAGLGVEEDEILEVIGREEGTLTLRRAGGEELRAPAARFRPFETPSG